MISTSITTNTGHLAHWKLETGNRESRHGHSTQMRGGKEPRDQGTDTSRDRDGDGDGDGDGEKYGAMTFGCLEYGVWSMEYGVWSMVVMASVVVVVVA